LELPLFLFGWGHEKRRAAGVLRWDRSAGIHGWGHTYGAAFSAGIHGWGHTYGAAIWSRRHTLTRMNAACHLRTPVLTHLTCSDRTVRSALRFVCAPIVTSELGGHGVVGPGGPAPSRTVPLQALHDKHVTFQWHTRDRLTVYTVRIHPRDVPITDYANRAWQMPYSIITPSLLGYVCTLVTVSNGRLCMADCANRAWQTPHLVLVAHWANRAWQTLHPALHEVLHASSSNTHQNDCCAVPCAH
jgi:hypothetical protein